MNRPMNRIEAGMIGGLVAGLATSLAMVMGRRAGLLQKTLAEDAEDWLDSTASTRRHLGETGTHLVEQVNHMAASAAFGAGYGVLRERFPEPDPWLLGALYGGGLYAINIAGIAPLIGLTEGEHRAGPSLRAERLGIHVLYGVGTALVADALRE